ncbi:chemotaxis protein CheV [Alteromonas sediminis]|uniref:Chemotaxis protein CheV n=1 Tax=Alteromonas sediminis TaxID=2259342 RepID=A0A3N5XYZ3_9ALTE|nr:chemotaxis protein CheV [Alteromonas sediminis]RPJ65703.1 chemotaxis protein CheV [Alteromonas sediminis]
MSGVLASVDQRTKLVGENRLELLLFRLGTRHVFAINVFKVKEVIGVPKMNAMPGSHSHLHGVTMYRGTSIPIINLNEAIKLRTRSDIAEGQGNVIITEYNRSVQGFLIAEVLSIVNTSWKDIQPPPNSIGKSNYLTAITQLDIQGKRELVEIIDVEKVLAEIIDYDVRISEAVLDQDIVPHLNGKTVLIVDDSSTARKQIKDTLSQLGLSFIECSNGLQALRLLQSWADSGENIYDKILMMFTDAEMPEMDGYRLTAEVRGDPRMNELFIALNTSLSGSFNQAMVEKVGCDRFISKFQPDGLVEVVQERMGQILTND